MQKINTNPPSGTRDFLPEDIRFRENIFNQIKNVFEKFGFLPLETPALERIDILTKKYGNEGEKLIYKILKRGDKALKNEVDLALRYDFTVPLARVVAKYQTQLPKIFRRFQIGPIWRAERPGKGRFREFYQADFDIVGIKSQTADAEIILILSEVLKSLGLNDFIIRINSKKILLGLLEFYKIPLKLQNSVLIALDKMEKIGIEGVKKELEKRGLAAKTIKKIFEDIKKAEENDNNIDVFKKYLEGSEIAQEGIDEIEKIIMLAKPFLKGGKIIFSPFLARGLDYYTGFIFETYLKEFSGSIASGGRYDNLIGLFAKKEIPACGGSLGIERIVMLLQKKLSQEKETQIATPVLVTVWNNDFIQDSFKIASIIRENNIAAEVFLGKANIKEQLGFASKRGFSFCVIFGPNEKTKNEVIIKDLRKNEQKSIPLKEFSAYFSNEFKNQKNIDKSFLV